MLSDYRRNNLFVTLNIPTLLFCLSDDRSPESKDVQFPLESKGLVPYNELFSSSTQHRWA